VVRGEEKSGRGEKEKRRRGEKRRREEEKGGKKIKRLSPCFNSCPQACQR